MDNPRQEPQEVRESGEKTEAAEQQPLNDATYTPESYVEQTGDYREAESIQNSLVVLVEDAQAAEGSVSAVAPRVPEKADASQATASSAESGGSVDAIPITVPDVQTAAGRASTLPDPLPSPATEEVSTLPLPLPSPGVEEASSLPLPIPSPHSTGTEEASGLPVPIPSPRSTAAEQGSSLPVPIPAPTSLEPPAVRGDLDQAESKTGSPEGDKATPINLPDVQAVRGMDPDPIVRPQAAAIAGEEIRATPITLPGREMPAPLPEEGEGTAGEESAAADAAPAGEAGAGEGGEWTPPPDWYIAIGPDGKPIVVDADGNPVDSPPLVKTVNPDGTSCNPMVYYQGGSEPVELPYYSSSLESCSVLIGSDGKAFVVDSNDKPLALQPIIQTVDENGQPCKPKVFYPGSGQEPVELPYVSTYAISYYTYFAHCSILVGADGKAVLVDADGKPKEFQPIIQTVDENGQPCEPKAYYYGTDIHEVTLPYYSNNLLDGCSIHTGADGKPVVVDASGKPLDVQPVIQTANPDGSPCEPKVYYPNSAGEPVELSYYSANLQDCRLHIGADGKPVVVDASGVPLASQPNIQTVDENGQPCEPKIYYQGGEENPVALSAYSAPLDGCSIYIGADGKPVVVDANGKPLPSQPVIQTVNPADGSPCPPQAYYKDAGGNPVELPYYTGPKPSGQP
jgi:hypothetical protein